jgi:hypothetical protein
MKSRCRRWHSLSVVGSNDPTRRSKARRIARWFPQQWAIVGAPTMGDPPSSAFHQAGSWELPRVTAEDATPPQSSP